MLFMIFGLPAAAYAIYKTSPGEKKNKVKALMIAGVAASIVSGITEPLEFAFMFIAAIILIPCGYGWYLLYVNVIITSISWKYWCRYY